MMERLAKTVIGHSKAIVIIWIIVLLVSAPFAYIILSSPQGILSYNVQDYDDSESGEGYVILKDEKLFDYNTLDYAIVANYKTPEQKNGLKILESGLKEKIGSRFSDDWSVTLAYVPDSDYKGNAVITVTLPDDFSKNKGVELVRDAIKDIRAANGDVIGKTYVTGMAAIVYDTAQASVQDVKRIDPFAVLLVLILIGLFFRSLVAAAVPPVTIGIAYSLTLMAIFGLAQMLDVFFITTTIALVTMLGAGCDYCIFIIARYREERRNGKDKEDALAEAVKWAGESVLVSGFCVIIGLGMLSLCSYTVMSSMGIVLAMGVLIALFAAVTLIPAVINLVGDRIFYPSKISDYSDTGRHGWYQKISSLGQRYFRRSAKFSIKHAGAILAAAIIITVPMTYVVATENTSFDIVSMMPDDEARQGVDQLKDTKISGVQLGGIIMPVYIVLQLDERIAYYGTASAGGKEYGTLNWTSYDTGRNITFSTSYISVGMIMPDNQGLAKDLTGNHDKRANIGIMVGAVSTHAVIDYAVKMMNQYHYKERVWDPLSAEEFILEKLKDISQPIYEKAMEIYGAFATIDERYPVYDFYINQKLGSLSINETGAQYVKITAILKDQPMSDKSMKTVENMRSICKDYEDNQRLDEMPKVDRIYTTGLSALMDDISVKATNEFFFIESIVVILILIMLLFVMKSYLTPIRSVLTIIMGIVWSLGLTHLFIGDMMGVPILWAVPILTFVICLGLGMDYDVLLTTRIREYVSKGMDTDTAIERAVEHSGTIITVCGFIMGGAYLTMVLSTTPLLQQFGLAIGLAILIDALIIRTYVVPAVMHLMGDWNWKGPRFLRR